ncbi:MAG: RrF2 family transcriptional regulator [Pseudomonadales bacterium]
MQLTRYTDYALRTLTYLAVQPDDRLSTSADICEAFALKKNHVSKIVHHLALAQLIETRRGKGGGFRLNRASLERPLGALISMLEGDAALIDCHTPICAIEPQCQLKHLLAGAQQAFYDYLDQYSLADLVAPKSELIRLLAIDIT